MYTYCTLGIDVSLKENMKTGFIAKKYEFVIEFYENDNLWTEMK